MAKLPYPKFPCSEDEILKCIDNNFDDGHPRILIGRGDDCAALKNNNNNICVSADLFLENVHFRRSYFEPGEIGHKALAVNISDLAGFGARPVAFTLCLGIPDYIEMGWLDGFFKGMSTLAREHRIFLAGGDLSRASSLEISITVLGENLENCGFLSRSGAMSGDAIFVVGAIGLARAGLMELEKNGRNTISAWPEAIAAHLVPMPQVEAGLMLARAGYNSRPPALMDLSDGILRDLPRLLGHNNENEGKRLGAKIALTPNMLHPEVVRHAESLNLDPVHEALLGGEDYALLGTCAQDMLPVLQGAIPGLWRLGEVTDSCAILCNDKNIEDFIGFDHFSTRNMESHL